MILVDSSVLIDYFRGRETPSVKRLDEIEAGQGGGWGLPLVCLQEVLQGARDEREWRALRRALESQLLIEPEDSVAAAVEAARIFFDCRRRGLTVRSSTDCFIAALALERGDVLLHDDADFEAIAKVRPLRTIRK